MSRNALIVPFLALLLACGASLADQEKAARAALDARDFAKARQLADAALASPDAAKDAPTAWRVEQIRLEALANDKQGKEVASTLERLAGTYAAQVNAALYRSLADKLKVAGDTSGAIDVLSAGDKRFPADHQAFVDAIGALQAEGNLDPAEVERLKALGYL